MITSTMLMEAASVVQSAYIDHPWDGGWELAEELLKLADRFNEVGD